MTGEEKRRQLKEQYKKDLMERKEILQKMKALHKMKRINHALEEMKSALNDDSEDWIDQLNQETAFTEAKLEVALDSAEEVDKKMEELAKEAEMEKLNAEHLVLKMKRELGLLTAEEEKPETEEGKEEKTEGKTAEKKEMESGDTPEKGKTLGDF